MFYRSNAIINLFPTAGIILFFLLFICSSLLYPGGSQFDANTVGFDWLNNYWCNLLNPKSINGDLNPARPFAITGMVVLCLGINYFFFQFSKVLAKSVFWKKSIKITGTISMLFAMMMFSKWHDEVTIISSIFGAVAILGVIIELYKSKLLVYKLSGLPCLLLLVVNNIIYYSEIGLNYLPLIQKVTLMVTLLWVISLNVKMVKMEMAEVDF